MIEWIADKLGIVALAPFWPPTVGFGWSVASILLARTFDDTPWAWAILLVSLGLAVWAWAEGHASVLAGFMAGVMGYYLILGLTTVLVMMRPLPYGCVMIDRHPPDACRENLILKSNGLPADAHGRP